MKRQSVGIVLCALLLTTFGHELVSRHQFAQSAKQAHSPRNSHFVSRDNSPSSTDLPDGCRVVCPPPVSEDHNLTISINTTTSIVVVANITVGIALVIDINANLVAIFNRTSGSGIIINLQDQTRIVIVTEGAWTASIDFNVWIQTITSLSVFYKQGRQVNISEVSITIQLALVILSNGEFAVSREEALKVLVSISVSLVASLRVVIKVVASGIFSVRITLKRLEELISGLVSVIVRIRGGIDVLIRAGIRISLNIVLSLNTSLDIWGYLIQTLPKNVWNDVFGDLTNTTNILQLIVSLSGNSTQGVNGLVNVILQISALIEGRGSIQVFIEVLVEFLSSKDRNVGAEWKAAVDGLYNLLVKLNLTSNQQLQVLVKFLVSIREGKWIQNNINISAIIQLLIAANESVRLNIIARIFVILSVQISINLLIAQLFLYFIELLAVQGGIQIIILITGIQVGAEYLQYSGNLLVRLLQSISLPPLGIGIGLIVRILRGLPIIGSLFVSINVSLKAAGSSVTVEQALGASNSGGIVSILVRFILHIRGGISVNGNNGIGNGNGNGGLIASGGTGGSFGGSTGSLSISGGNGGHGGSGGGVGIGNGNITGGGGGSISGSATGSGSTGVNNSSADGGDNDIYGGAGGNGGDGSQVNESEGNGGGSGGADVSGGEEISEGGSGNANGNTNIGGGSWSGSWSAGSSGDASSGKDRNKRRNHEEKQKHARNHQLHGKHYVHHEKEHKGQRTL